MRLQLAGFAGANRFISPKGLPDSVGVDSVNQRPGRPELRPLRAPLAVASVPAGRNSIYRMGRDVARDDLYWLSWAGQVNAVRGMVSGDTTERTYYTGDGEPRWTDNTRALASAPYPTAYRPLGVPVPGTMLSLAASGGSSSNTTSRYYVYTWVTDIGEESAPSPVSAELVCKTDATVTITGFGAVPNGNYGVNRIRIYRTETGQSGSAEFFFLREVAYGTTTTTDDGRALGESIATVGWLPPPANLTGLTGMWNGMMAAISGPGVRYCVPYKPYAWRIADETLPPDATPVALSVYGQAMLVLTTGAPLLVTGGSPDGLDEQPVRFAEACVSARSVVSVGHGVVWACPDGLAYFGDAGPPRILTAGILSRDDWQAMKPATILGALHEGIYIGFYEATPGSIKGFMLDPVNPTGIYFLDMGAVKAVFFDELQDQLYVLIGTQIMRWDAGAAVACTFKSKVWRMTKPMVAPSAIEVVADQYPVTVKLYADGVLRATKAVASRNPERLPSGYRAVEYQVEVQASGPVQLINIATTMGELAQS